MSCIFGAQSNIFKQTLAKIKPPKFVSDEDVKATKEQEEKDEQKNLLMRSGLYPHKDIKIVAVNPGQEALIKKLRGWLPSHKLPYVYGPPGVGKTWIARAFGVRAVKKHSLSIKYVKSIELFPTLAAAKFKGDIQPINEAMWAQVLILDDFPYHAISSTTLSIMHQIINYRTEYQKPTLITSNISIAEVAKSLQAVKSLSAIDQNMCVAIEDRLFELCTIAKIESESIRLQQAASAASKGG